MPGAECRVPRAVPSAASGAECRVRRVAQGPRRCAPHQAPGTVHQAQFLERSVRAVPLERDRLFGAPRGGLHLARPGGHRDDLGRLAGGRRLLRGRRCDNDRPPPAPPTMASSDDTMPSAVSACALSASLAAALSSAVAAVPCVTFSICAMAWVTRPCDRPRPSAATSPTPGSLPRPPAARRRAARRPYREARR